MSLVLTQNEQDVLQSTLESPQRSEVFRARLQYMNEGGMAVLEICDLGPMIGSSWIEFRDGEDKKAAAAAVEKAKRGEAGRFVGYFPTTQTHQPRWWDVLVTAINDAQGRPEHLLAVSRDVTPLKQTEEVLRVATQETAAATSDNFFQLPAQHLASAFDARYALAFSILWEAV